MDENIIETINSVTSNIQWTSSIGSQEKRSGKTQYIDFKINVDLYMHYA